MTSSCSRLNLGYFRVLRNPTNQADKEVVTKGEEKGRKKDTGHHNQKIDSEAKISCDQKLYPFLGLQAETNGWYY